MIPLQLTLKNFLSYREATLDFRGLHTACICGANGAGKSSLLEAITWAVWGQSRTASEDDTINAGAKDVRVDFTFISNQQTYRVIRSRTRGRSASLDFQVESTGGFRSLNAKGMRATQQEIIAHLKLDYDTFVNSAYLRQGRADEFMLRRPNERKQILADLLKLDRYEELAEQAKGFSKQLKGQAEQLQQSLQPLQEQLGEKAALVEEKAKVAKEIKQLQQLQEQDHEKLQQLEKLQNQRQTWQQQFSWQQTQYQNVSQDCDRTVKEKEALQGQIQGLQRLLGQEEEIKQGYQHLLQLQKEEELFSSKFQAYQDAQQRKQQLGQELAQQTNQLSLQLSQYETKLETLLQQERELQEVLSHSQEVAVALTQLNKCRQRLRQLDELQLQVSPLLQRRNNLQMELERVEARLNARLEQLSNLRGELQVKVNQVPQTQQQILTVEAEIKQLDNKKIHQQRVEEKGNDQKSFQERFQEQQRLLQRDLGELQQKLEMLQTPGAVCPLCEQDLDDHYRQRVVSKTEAQQQEIQDKCWVLREQMATCERELQGLRVEYAQLRKEMSPYNNLLQQKGQLEAQLENTGQVQQRLLAINAETAEIERSLAVGNYALELHAELENLQRKIASLNYDEQTHALARGEVENYRWAEIKQAKLEDASKRQGQLQTQRPQLEGQIVKGKRAIEELRQTSPLQQEINLVEQYIKELGYERSHHNQIMTAVRQANGWQLRYQQLQQGQQQYPQLEDQSQQLQQRLEMRLQDQETVGNQLKELQVQMSQNPDYSQEIQALQHQVLQVRRRQLDQLLAQQGSHEQRLVQIDSLAQQYQATETKLAEIKKQYRVYQELAQAFGKKGIQALMIENILPQLEAQTNQILARLTGNQLHVQFLTQRASKSSKSKRKTTKMIDTLDILIADARGTRPYETYSGGEGFRINFAIRLALARLLAQRAGTSLQMLIIDEGFGTQDAEGCERLIAAINAIAADFSCILTVTHMPQFKEAFQTRIEVSKTNQGSQLLLSS
ncbi:MAG: exonuclease subunit SbcC [Spirulinaceae cyanobacterium]